MVMNFDFWGNSGNNSIPAISGAPVVLATVPTSTSVLGKSVNANKSAADVAKAAAASNPTANYGDALSTLFGQANDLLGATTPVTPGHMVSQAALRNQLNQNYQQQDADRAAAYQGAIDTILGRAGDIGAGYDTAASDARSDADARSQALNAMLQSNQQNVLQGAAALGLGHVPNQGNSRSAQQTAQSIDQLSRAAEAWANLNSANKQTALERNQASADAINYQGLLQQAALQAQLNAALQNAQDYWVGGSGGGSLLSGSQQASLLNNMANWLGDADTSDLNWQKLGLSSSPEYTYTYGQDLTNPLGVTVKSNQPR